MSDYRGKARVLIVDDEPNVVLTYGALLQADGFEVSAALGFVEAVKLVGWWRPDLVITDLMLAPLENGLELIKWLRETAPATKSMILTGYGTMVVDQCRELGILLLDKPIDSNEFLSVVRAVIDGEEVPYSKAQLELLLSRNVSSDPISWKLLEEARRIAESGSGIIRGNHNAAIGWHEYLNLGIAAKLIHALSPRASEQFIDVDASAYESGEFQRVLFGNRQSSNQHWIGCSGALELAEKGTFFLRNVEKVSCELQQRLCRAVFERGDGRHFDVRLLASTSLPVSTLGNTLLLSGLGSYLSGWSLEVPATIENVFSVIGTVVDGYLDRVKRVRAR